MFDVVALTNTKLRDASRTAIIDKLIMNRRIGSEPPKTGHDRFGHICQPSCRIGVSFVPSSCHVLAEDR
jgi:hypothetical protein